MRLVCCEELTNLSIQGYAALPQNGMLSKYQCPVFPGGNSSMKLMKSLNIHYEFCCFDFELEESAGGEVARKRGDI